LFLNLFVLTFQITALLSLHTPSIISYACYLIYIPNHTALQDERREIPTRLAEAQWAPVTLHGLVRCFPSPAQSPVNYVTLFFIILIYGHPDP
jgi:hypothetical protein